MVQRIQSIYLLLTTIFSILFLSGNFITFTDKLKNSLVIDIKGLSRVDAAGATEHLTDMFPLILLLFLVPLISLITIFLFKKRKLQLRLCMGLIILIILLISAIMLYSFYVTRTYSADIIPGFKLILPALMLICAFLAFRGIKKDEKLVKSYDRLR